MFSEISKKKIKNAGFSLIELIIVVAIMVALVAVLAPNYVKYVKKSRDAVITSAAEEFIEFAKAEYTAGTLTGSARVKVGADSANKVSITFEAVTDLSYEGSTGNDACDAFVKACGSESGRTTTSDLFYIIELNGSDANKLDVSFNTTRES